MSINLPSATPARWVCKSSQHPIDLLVAACAISPLYALRGPCSAEAAALPLVVIAGNGLPGAVQATQRVWIGCSQPPSSTTHKWNLGNTFSVILGTMRGKQLLAFPGVWVVWVRLTADIVAPLCWTLQGSPPSWRMHRYMAPADISPLPSYPTFRHNN